ncbi:condensation domain-containing protein [Streptomyces sp. M10(2022)]
MPAVRRGTRPRRRRPGRPVLRPRRRQHLVDPADRPCPCGGTRPQPRDVFTHQTPATLAAAARSAEAPAGPRGPTTTRKGRCPLACAQLVHRTRRQRRTVRQSRFLELPAGSDLEMLRATVETIVRRHDALRLRLVGEGGGQSLEIQNPDSVDLADAVRRVGLATEPDGGSARMAKETEAARDRLDPREGRNVEVVWFDRGPEEAGLALVAIHHFAVDEVSWRILLPELIECWNALRENRDPELRPIGTSLGQWTRALHTEARNPAGPPRQRCGSDCSPARITRWATGRSTGTATSSTPRPGCP